MHASILGLVVLQWAGASPTPVRVPAPPEIAWVAVSVTRAPVQEVDYSTNYYRRLDVHRAAAYALIPLFALQVSAGLQLYDQGDAAPLWARFGHRVGATGIAALFATNVVTGLPNLVAGFRDPADRGRRFTHAALMLSASAGFIATGLLAEKAEGSPDDRAMHRTIALSSVGVATVSYLMMLDTFRPE